MLLSEALNIVIDLATRSSANNTGIPKQREEEAIELVQKTFLHLISTLDITD
jgi:hypothetical protein